MAGGRLPVARSNDVIRALKKAGFVTDRIVGSHHVMVFPNDPTRTVTVPVHSGRDLKPGTLRAIIRTARFSVEEFARLL